MYTRIRYLLYLNIFYFLIIIDGNIIKTAVTSKCVRGAFMVIREEKTRLPRRGNSRDRGFI